MKTEFSTPGSPRPTPKQSPFLPPAPQSTLQQSAEEDAADLAFDRSVQNSLSRFWACAQWLALLLLAYLFVVRFR